MLKGCDNFLCKLSTDWIIYNVSSLCEGHPRNETTSYSASLEIKMHDPVDNCEKFVRDCVASVCPTYFKPNDERIAPSSP